MFDSKIYTRSRNKLKKQLKSGIALFLGNEESPMNYRDNPFHFRQDSSFLYFLGLDSPGLAGIVDVDEEKDIVFGNDPNVEDIIWMGDLPKLKDRAIEAGIAHSLSFSELEKTLKTAILKGKKIHFLPPYRMENTVKLSQILGLHESMVKTYASEALIKAVVEQRSIKIKEEIDQIEKAHSIAYEMHTTAMKMTKPGIFEYEIAGKIEGIAAAMGGRISFPIILTINGQILHNHYHGNTLKSGQMFLLDAGAEVESGYAADLSSTVPVDTRFTPVQRDIYNITLDSHDTAIGMLAPGTAFKEIYLESARVIVRGLKDMGIMKDNVDDAVASGAHALFFPCGLGHMMGMDVHDMEDLGEIYVGWDGQTRPTQFGIKSLRLGRKLEPGFVLTIEPGIYFIPELIDQWRQAGTNSEFINFDRVNEFRNFGGIRNEEDFLITETAYRLLGKPKPKTIEDVEAERARELPL